MEREGVRLKGEVKGPIGVQGPANITLHRNKRVLRGDAHLNSRAKGWTRSVKRHKVVTEGRHKSSPEKTDSGISRKIVL